MINTEARFHTQQPDICQDWLDDVIRSSEREPISVICGADEPEDEKQPSEVHDEAKCENEKIMETPGLVGVEISHEKHK